MKVEFNTIVKPLPDEILLNKCEEQWRLILPVDYRMFIKQYNGAIPNTRSFIFFGNKFVINRFLCILRNPQNSDLGWYDINVVESQIGERLTENEDLIGIEILPIAELYAGDYVCMDFRKDAMNPSICIWYHEKSNEFSPSVCKIADSFSDFLEILNWKINCKNDACFTGETLISTRLGMKRIDEIVAGDKVYSFDEPTQKVSLKTVLQVMKKNQINSYISWCKTSYYIAFLPGLSKITKGLSY